MDLVDIRLYEPCHITKYTTKDTAKASFDFQTYQYMNLKYRNIFVRDQHASIFITV